jgi:hypothetical protein
MASKQIGWVTVNPSSGSGNGTISVSGSAYEGRGMRQQTLWFNPTNSTEVESVQFNIKQLAKGILFSNFKEGSTAVTLNKKVGTKTIGQAGTTASYSFKTNAKSVYIHVQNVSGRGGNLQITNVKINNVQVQSSTANPTTSLIINTPTNDPGATGAYDVQFTVSIGSNTGTVNRNIVLFIAGADDDTDTSKFQAAYANYRGSSHKECFANINITQSYSKPSVSIKGDGVVAGSDGVYTTNSIPVDGTAQTFEIEASDNLQWSIDDKKVTPNIESGDFDDITKL